MDSEQQNLSRRCLWHFWQSVWVSGYRKNFTKIKNICHKCQFISLLGSGSLFDYHFERLRAAFSPLILRLNLPTNLVLYCLPLLPVSEIDDGSCGNSFLCSLYAKIGNGRPSRQSDTVQKDAKDKIPSLVTHQRTHTVTPPQTHTLTHTCIYMYICT